MVLLYRQYNSIWNILSADTVRKRYRKRESGEKPERSGHCNGGANLTVHCT